LLPLFLTFAFTFAFLLLVVCTTSGYAEGLCFLLDICAATQASETLALQSRENLTARRKTKSHYQTQTSGMLARQFFFTSSPLHPFTSSPLLSIIPASS
jgi:hypothetical protein